MKRLLLSSPLLLGLLTACKKDDTPGPLAYTLSRSVSLSPAGLRLDTTYTSSQLRLEASLGQWSPQEQDLFLHFGGEMTKDEVTLRIPVSKLQPGWIGTYTFQNIAGASYPYTQPPSGEASLNCLFRYYPNRLAGLSSAYSEPGSFTISRYDAKRHLLSGQFRYETTSSIDLSPLTTGVQGYQLVLTGSFDNLVVVQ
ncbi:MAG: hypothetical protein ACRYG7_20165 [Janthinobacterium lividum]